MFQRTGKELPGAGEFYDHTEGEPVWGQDLVYAFYTDDKTSYPLVFRQYEKDDEDQDDEDETKYDLVREMITELEEEVVYLRTPTSSTHGSPMTRTWSSTSNPT